MAFNFDSAKRFAGDVGDRIIGKGRQVDFRQEVRSLVERGMSEGEAKKQAFLDRLNGLNYEASSGVIDLNTDNYRNLIAGMKEIYTQTQIKDLEQNVFGSSFRSILTTPADARKVGKMRDYLDSKYGKENTKRVPSLNRYALDGANATEMILLLSGRLNMEAAASPDDLDSLLMANPEFAADLSKLMAAKKMLESHEKGAKRQIDAYEARHRLKETTKKAFDDIAWSGLAKFMKSMIGVTRGKKDLASGFMETASYLTKVTVGLGRVAVGTIESIILTANSLRE